MNARPMKAKNAKTSSYSDRPPKPAWKSTSFFCSLRRHPLRRGLTKRGFLRIFGSDLMRHRFEIARPVAAAWRVRELTRAPVDTGSRSPAVGLLLLSLLFSAGLSAADREPASPAAALVTLDSDTHLVGWWKFDETSGKRAADSAKPGHEGVLEGDLSFDTHSATGRSG